MKRINIQFHATVEDIYVFVEDMLFEGYSVKAITIGQDFICNDLSNKITLDVLKKYNRIFISKKGIDDANNYNDFMKRQINTIGIDLGIIKQDTITEMIMWICAEDEIDIDFKKIINSFKKSMLKGAWGMLPGKEKEKVYYKNHMYTYNAKKAYEQGTKLCAYAGVTYFEIIDC